MTRGLNSFSLFSTTQFFPSTSTKIFFSNIILQWNFLRRLAPTSCMPVAVQCMELPAYRTSSSENIEHSLQIFLGKCLMMVSSFITVRAYLLAAFVACLVHTSSSSIAASNDTLHLLRFTAASHLNKLNNTFMVRFQLIPTTCKINFVSKYFCWI